jgi:hypothetical protein
MPQDILIGVMLLVAAGMASVRVYTQDRPRRRRQF